MNNRFEILPDVFLTAVQTDKFKTGCFSVNFVRPMRRSEAACNALIPSVLLRASEKYPSIRSISAALDELYGASMGTLVRKKGEIQLTGFFADYIEDELVGEPIFHRMCRFVAEILLHPLKENGVFVKSIVEGEKLNLQNAMLARINDKRSYVVSELLKTMCADEAYGIPRVGDPEDLEPIDEKTLYAHYREVLENSRVEIFYMGRRSADAAADELREMLRELPRGSAVSAKTDVVLRADAVREEIRTMDVTQGKLAIGLRTGCTAADAEYPALLMMNAIFGGSVTSKLFTGVREEMGLCYYASSSVEKFKGVMLVSSGIECDQYETAKTEILRRLDECREGKISEYEFESAKRYILSDLKAAMDSPGRLDDYYMGQSVAGLVGTMGELAEQIARVTPEQVAEAARRVTLDTVYFLKGAEA